jgi:hypothetical protein
VALGVRPAEESHERGVDARVRHPPDGSKNFIVPSASQLRSALIVTTARLADTVRV